MRPITTADRSELLSLSDSVGRTSNASNLSSYDWYQLQNGLVCRFRRRQASGRLNGCLFSGTAEGELREPFEVVPAAVPAAFQEEVGHPPYPFAPPLHSKGGFV